MREQLGAKDVVKQLWVAAIDLNHAPGVDPSHPPFLLPGQDTTSLNMRGFWALDPCKGDGQGCATGTECCNGSRDGMGADGGLVCKAGACAAEGDRCQVASDCCEWRDVHQSRLLPADAEVTRLSAASDQQAQEVDARFGPELLERVRLVKLGGAARDVQRSPDVEDRATEHD